MTSLSFIFLDSIYVQALWHPATPLSAPRDQNNPVHELTACISLFSDIQHSTHSLQIGGDALGAVLDVGQAHVRLPQPPKSPARGGYCRHAGDKHNQVPLPVDPAAEVQPDHDRKSSIVWYQIVRCRGLLGFWRPFCASNRFWLSWCYLTVRGWDEHAFVVKYDSIYLIYFVWCKSFASECTYHTYVYTWRDAWTKHRYICIYSLEVLYLSVYTTQICFLSSLFPATIITTHINSESRDEQPTLERQLIFTSRCPHNKADLHLLDELAGKRDHLGSKSKFQQRLLFFFKLKNVSCEYLMNQTELLNFQPTRLRIPPDPCTKLSSPHNELAKKVLLTKVSDQKLPQNFHFFRNFLLP